MRIRSSVAAILLAVLVGVFGAACTDEGAPADAGGGASPAATSPAATSPAATSPAPSATSGGGRGPDYDY